MSPVVIMSHNLSQLSNMKCSTSLSGHRLITQLRNQNKEQKHRQECDITLLWLIFSFRTFVIKKLGNTKIDSWIVMPIMTI